MTHVANYGPEMTLGDARALLFERSGFAPDGGYGDRWVRVNLWRIPIWFPNTKGRRRAVKFHDLHHVLTEYPTTWRGETEIGAWEVASGCESFYQGWVLNLLSFAIGLVINPRGVYAAFMRGRRSRNLYRTEFNEALLSSRVGDVRRRLGLDVTPAEPTTDDKVSFVAWAAASVVTYFAAGAVLLAPLGLLALAALWWWFF